MHMNMTRRNRGTDVPRMVAMVMMGAKVNHMRRTGVTQPRRPRRRVYTRTANRHIKVNSGIRLSCHRKQQRAGRKDNSSNSVRLHKIMRLHT